MAKTCSLVRCGSLAAVVAVPALAVAFFGFGAGAFSFGNPQVSETRDFNRGGQNVTVPAGASDAAPAEVFLENWQNTVRTPPSPRI